MTTPGAGTTLVLGGSGWIGREVVSLAQRSGPAIDASRRPSTADSTRVSSAKDLGQVLRSADVGLVVNCAGSSIGSADALTSANVEFAMMVGTVCLQSGVRLVHVGSAAEYGAVTDVLIAEDAQTDPVTAYGRSKLAATRALLALRDQGLDVTVARAFNVVGPGQPSSTPMGQFAAAIRQLPHSGGEVVVHDATLVRDFVSRTYVADALLRLGRAGSHRGVVNVCSGRGLSFASLIEAMAQVHGSPVRIVSDARGGIPRVVGDPSLLHTLIGDSAPEGVAGLAEQILRER